MAEWTPGELRRLRKLGARRSPAALAARLGRSADEIAAKLAEVGVRPHVEAAPDAGRTSWAARVGWFLFLALVVGTPFVFDPYSAESFTQPQGWFWQALISLMAVAGGWCLWRGGRVSLPTTVHWLGPLAFLLLQLPAVFASTNPALSVRTLLFLALGTATAVAAMVLLDAESRLRQVALGLTLAALLQSAFGILQYFGVDPIFRTPDIGRLKVFGTLGNPNFLGEYLSCALPLAVAVAWRAESRTRRLAGAAAVLLALVAIACTGSKGALLATVTGLAALAVGTGAVRNWARLRSRRVLAPLTGVLLLLALFGMAGALRPGAFPIADNLLGSLDLRGRSVGIRVIYWHATAAMVGERPLLGWGPGCFQAHYLDFQGAFLSQPENYSFLDTAGNPESAHNDYLQIAAESGLVGFAGFTALLIWAFHGGLARRREPGSPWAIAALACLVASLTQSLVSFPLFRPASALLFWLLLAASRAPVARVAIAVPRAAGMAALAAALLFAAWSGRDIARSLVAERACKQGRLCADSEQWEAAADHCQRGLRADPGHGRLLLGLGQVLFRQGNDTEAIATLTRSSAFVRTPQAHLDLADAFDRAGRREEAIRAYQLALRLAPDNPTFLNNYAATLHAAGRFPEAFRLWQRALARDPRHAGVLTNLAVARCQAGELQAAAALAERLLAQSQASPQQRRQAETVLQQARAAGKAPAPP